MSTSTHSSGNRNHSPVMSQSRSWPTRLPPLPPRVSRNLVDPRAHPWFAPPPPFATAQPRQPLPPTRAQQHSSPATSYAADENSKRKRPNEDIGDGLRPAKMPNQLPSPTMRCLICLEMLSFRRYPLVSHMHKHYSAVCIDCWQCHIASHVDDTAKGSNIQCAQCNLVLSEAEIKTLATANVYNKWLDKAAKTYCNSDVEFRACPSGSCSWGCFFTTKKDGNIFTCHECKVRYCVVCEELMHEHETCAKHRELTSEQRLEENQASERGVEATTKPCPACGLRLQKDDGCDHMTCFCDHEFCWLCSASYLGDDGIEEQGNRAHDRGCPHHADNLPNAPGDEEDEVEDSDEDYSDDEA